MKQAMNSSANIVIGGLHCPACVRRLEKVLAGVDGVAEARVNLATGRAFFLPAAGAELALDKVEAAVAASGL